MIKRLFTLTATLLISVLASAQQFNYLHSGLDSTADYVHNILLRTDGTFFLAGNSWQPVSDNQNPADAMWMNVSSNGANVLSVKHLHRHQMGLYMDYSGGVKQLPNIGYIMPYTANLCLFPYPYPGRYYTWAGLIALNFQMDTIFYKTYTDTAQHRENVYDCGVLPDGSILMAGWQSSSYISSSTVFDGMLIGLAPNGNMNWKHTYQRPGYYCELHSIQPLDATRSLISGTLTDTAATNGYFKAYPWFLLINNDGTLIRDTFFSNGYHYRAPAYSDMNGGYFFGAMTDSLLTSTVSDNQNFPPCLTHLDTNFNTDWQTLFPYGSNIFPDYIYKARQLMNGDYLVCGAGVRSGVQDVHLGWAARVDPAGNILWSKYYDTDNWKHGWLSDMVERADSTLVFCGTAWNDTISMHQSYQAWILATDADGNILDQTTFVPNKHSGDISFQFYPNPAASSFTIKTPGKGVAELFDMSGKRLASWSISGNTTQIDLPPSTAPGNYFLQFTGLSGLAAGKLLTVK
ncbi:MAG TPA: T9SS type A sorting domain-containing protein [Flavipsychrobacter sp.]|nr:T9SS type A sorting domain-containing protein [Flavipsychrobacter sp.]